MPSTDDASSSVSSQLRDSVPSQRNQFTRKYEAQWKDDLSMDFKPKYILDDIWSHYLEHVTSEQFTRCSQSGAGNHNRPIHGSTTMHTGGSVPFVVHAKRMPDEVVCGDALAESRPPKESATNTYNNRLRERYGDDTLTHLEFDPDLWMEVGLLGAPDKHQVYGLSNTTVDNLGSARSASIVRSTQSISSSQSKEFVALQQHTTQLTKKYDHLSEAYTQRKVSQAQQRAESKQQKAAYEQLRKMHLTVAATIIDDFQNGYIRSSVFQTLIDKFTDGMCPSENHAITDEINSSRRNVELPMKGKPMDVFHLHLERDLGKAMESASKFVKERVVNKKVTSDSRKDFLDVLLEFRGSGKDEPDKLKSLYCISQGRWI
ncbi:hypothetical protein NC653_034383 [Populus alba x Populus x berolinensis]|uniref:Uncharacterized protein n=1 Tax=Populus alba x Populus x berolinensis TaxID=444605 RepID=A0AAD6LQA4_9ROSI|nr:hypothetical protein NC653_034383 [Populus alba x Populus x berolinensis]